MSSQGSHDKSSGGKKKKKDLWKEAGGEFYQERYPKGSGAGQANSTADLTQETQERRPRHHIPLPSQTARRNNSFIPNTSRKYLTRNKHSSYNTTTINGNNCMTYTSTMGGINEMNSDVHIALMPDLADETIPNEKTTYEALVKIKALPEPMHQKRVRKTKISNIPQLRLTGWKRLKWESKKGWKEIKRSFNHENRNFAFLQKSLRTIEIRCGTSIVNVFFFIKWTLLLNLLISIVMLLLIIIPYFIIESVEKKGPVREGHTHYHAGDGCTLIQNYSKNANYSFANISDRIECCTRAYHDDKEFGIRGSLSDITRIILMTNGSIEGSAFFFGYYMHDNSDRTSNYDLFAVIYVLVIAGILFFSLLLMVRNVGVGIQELIMSTEGEHNQYTNLVFAGWDFYTADVEGAKFKRKVLKHEMKVALISEKRNLESLVRNRKERIKMTGIRVFVNLLVILLLAAAGGVILTISTISLEKKATRVRKEFHDTSISEHLDRIGFAFAPSIVISFFNVIFPVILQKIGKMEKYSKQTETALVLIRALFIRLMSVGFVVGSFYGSLYYCELEDAKVCTMCKSGYTHPKREYCWESLFADQIYKLIVVDLILKCLIAFIVDPLRLLIKRMSKRKIFQQIGNMKFSIVRHSLDLIYLQALSWLGMYFGPIIPIISVVYCFIVFYIKKFSVLHCCNAVPDTYKAMKTTTIFVAAKLMAFIFVTFTNVAVMGYLMPSRGCGPFRKYDVPWAAVRELIETSTKATAIYDYVASPGITTPLTMILTLLAYYYYAVAQANRGMVDTLRHLLILEGHDKQYLFARLNSLRRPRSPTVSNRSESTTNQRD